MKTITLSVDDRTLGAVRVCTAEWRTTVNAPIREFLGQITMQHNRAEAAMARLGKLTEQSRFLPSHNVRGEME